MAKQQMKDIVVLVPGITGSVLQKDGEDIWNLSLQAVLRAFDERRKLDSWIKNLIIQKDDIQRDYLDDGIKATGIIQVPRLVPGFFKLEGYSYIRNQLTENFNVILGKVDEDKPANYFEFAYDWRRDNRVAARLLGDLINNKLRIWREKINPKAKVIIIAHSMGGLVSRYYVEHLEGWQDCKALVTLGTPYRGSVKILNYLANGYLKDSWLNDRVPVLTALRDVLRSFTSAYQLLSTYPVVNIDGNWQRIAEIDGIPGVVKQRAIEGREFLECFNSPKNINYYEFIPIIGKGQRRTFQSATFSNGSFSSLKASYDILPPNPKTKDSVHPSYATGDNTVPLLSAKPIGLPNKWPHGSLIESHGALQSNAHLWDVLNEYLLQDEIEDYRNPQDNQSQTPTAGISLSVDDLYLRDEEVTLDAEIINVKSDILEKNGNFGGLRAIITPVNVNGEQENVPIDLLQKQDTQYQVTLPPNRLLPGLYRLEVKTKKSRGSAPKAVHDLFQVIE